MSEKQIPSTIKSFTLRSRFKQVVHTGLNAALEEFETVFKWVLSGIIEAFFIVCFIITQWGLDEYVIKRYRLTGVDDSVLTIAQWLFAGVTIIPIVFNALRLVITVAIRTYRDIRKEVKGDENT